MSRWPDVETEGLANMAKSIMRNMLMLRRALRARDRKGVLRSLDLLEGQQKSIEEVMSNVLDWKGWVKPETTKGKKT